MLDPSTIPETERNIHYVDLDEEEGDPSPGREVMEVESDPSPDTLAGVNMSEV